MTKKERAELILKELTEQFPETPVPLHHKNAFELLVAVLLSAQCTDERVNRHTPKLFELASHPEPMSRLTVEEIDAIVRPCGLSPTKAKNILNLSKILVEKHMGEVPRDLEALKSLPGVGHKTASVVMSQWFGEDAFPVDTHIHRLAQVWKLTDGSSVEKTERDLKALFPVSTWNQMHLRIIFYGREVCPARSCFGLTCRLCKVMFPRRRTPVQKRK